MTEHVDVVIVGAGIAGISAAWHLQDRCPDKRYLILEARDNLGGTWDLFKYPGFRCDSEMFTLGFRFKPWTDERSIADGPTIWNYVNDAAVENGIDKHIRYRHRVVSANWSSADEHWILTIDRGGENVEITCSFLHACSGYYNYEEGYRPAFPGEQDFTGTIVHPQHWPEELDYAGKRMVVIGSGATAVTLIPALVDSGAGHVTMLQRSPTYIGVLPVVDPISVRLNRWLPTKPAYFFNRWKAILFSTGQYDLSRHCPKLMRNILMRMARRRLPKGYDVDKHFGPRYNPWDERLCLAPNGDLFKTITAGDAEVITDTIDTFTPTGIRLTSGVELPADIIVTATGLNMQLFGGATVSIDGQPVDLSKTMTFKGLILSGIPNMAVTFGYTNQSWTLKADLVSEFICRLLNHMDEQGFHTVVAQHPGDEIEVRPLMDFTPGYFKRAMDGLPKSGGRAPWRLKENYLQDIGVIRRGKVDDDALHFTRRSAAVNA